MNYRQARERMGPGGEATGLWDWTTMRDKKVWPDGACREQACVHQTAEAAEHHEWSRRTAIVVRTTDRDSLLRCRVCKDWTHGRLSLPLGEHPPERAPCCAVHEDGVSVWRKLYPFAPGMQEIASW